MLCLQVSPPVEAVECGQREQLRHLIQTLPPRLRKHENDETGKRRRLWNWSSSERQDWTREQQKPGSDAVASQLAGEEESAGPDERHPGKEDEISVFFGNVTAAGPQLLDFIEKNKK